MEKTIMQQLKEANIPIDTHESDLYCKVTEESTKILKEYLYKCIVSTFWSKVDNELWFDIPFANDEFWDNKTR